MASSRYFQVIKIYRKPQRFHLRQGPSLMPFFSSLGVVTKIIHRNFMIRFLLLAEGRSLAVLCIILQVWLPKRNSKTTWYHESLGKWKCFILWTQNRIDCYRKFLIHLDLANSERLCSSFQFTKDGVEGTGDQSQVISKEGSLKLNHFCLNIGKQMGIV